MRAQTFQGGQEMGLTHVESPVQNLRERRMQQLQEIGSKALGFKPKALLVVINSHITIVANDMVLIKAIERIEVFR